MTRKEYNGWTNYETWLVKLWMDNDEGSQEYFREMAEESFKTDGNDATISLADAVKEAHDEMLPDAQGFVADLLNAAMSEVDWREIAESLLSDYCEDYGKEAATA